jgi:hypothetical protein
MIGVLIDPAKELRSPPGWHRSLEISDDANAGSRCAIQGPLFNEMIGRQALTLGGNGPPHCVDGTRHPAGVVIRVSKLPSL